MDKTANNNEIAPTDKPPTAPDRFIVSVQCFGDTEKATQFAQLIGTCIREISRYIDLSRLDGITIASDYNQALVDLDRGYATTHQLTPSDEYAFGVAMTPSVIRDGNVMSHIVLSATIAVALEDQEHENFKLALHMLAHECAHVEVNHRFDAAFPGVLLQKAYDNAHDAFRWQTILACWDEYAATLISAHYGQDPSEGYEETFILALTSTRKKANELITAYRLHGDVNQIMAEVYRAYGTLMKFAGYHLGNMAGQGLSVKDFPKTITALDGHWFAPYFERLQTLLNRVADDYGNWSDQSQFEAIGELVDEIVVEGGVIVSHLSDGSLYVDIPFTPETMPS